MPVKQIPLGVKIEAILFAAAEPVSLAALAAATGEKKASVKSALDELSGKLAGRGVRLLRHEDSCQLVTAPEAAAAVAGFLGEQVRSELSKPALETLAIVAYRQPVTRGQIEEIRGVASDQTLRNLLQRGLIDEAGRSETAGRPILYQVSAKFLQHFGLERAADLPPLPEGPDAH